MSEVPMNTVPLSTEGLRSRGSATPNDHTDTLQPQLNETSTWLRVCCEGGARGWIVTCRRSSVADENPVDVDGEQDLSTMDRSASSSVQGTSFPGPAGVVTREENVGVRLRSAAA